MDCLYLPQITTQTIRDRSVVELDIQNVKHVKALRLRVGDNLLVSNGKGLLALTNVKTISRTSAKLRLVEDYTEQVPENNIVFDLFVSPLSDSARFEFIIEKAVELGARHIHLFKSKNSEFRSVRLERLQAKAEAALKQNQRSILPQINDPIAFGDIANVIRDYTMILYGDPSGEPIYKYVETLMAAKSSLALIVGPEGGLTNSEMGLLSAWDNSVGVAVSRRRLRSETAAIALMSLVASF